MPLIRSTAAALVLVAFSTFAPVASAGAAASGQGSKLCMPVPRVSIDGGSPAFTPMSDALRKQLAGILAGPLLQTIPLQARLPSQIRAEAASVGCAHVLTFVFDHRPKSQLGRQSADAALDVGRAATSVVDLGSDASSALGAASTIGGLFKGNSAPRSSGFYPVGKNDSVSIQYTLTSLGTDDAPLARTVSGKAAKANEPLVNRLMEQMAEAVLAVIAPP